ncbi:MAG: glycosyltransferase family 2 protein, partial [Solirubrobacteraceae bacterium]
MSRRVTPVPLLRRPSVTVVMPCYNYGHYLSRALTSVLSQPEVDVDVILIDDASPDGSGDVVRALAAADSRIHPILHERNHGHIATYNEGLELATGDYV